MTDYDSSTRPTSANSGQMWGTMPFTSQMKIPTLAAYPINPPGCRGPRSQGWGTLWFVIVVVDVFEANRIRPPCLGSFVSCALRGSGRGWFPCG